MSKSKPLDRAEAIKRIDKFIADHDDWRGEIMAETRQIFHEVAPDVIEDWKYMGSPFWSREGILGHGNIFKAKVKLTLHHGAKLPDPHGIFNASLNASQFARDRYLRGRRDQCTGAQDLAARSDGVQ